MTTGVTEKRQSVPPDVVLSAVAHEQCRAVLRSLDHTAEKSMEFDELVDQVAEHGRTGDPPNDDHRQRVRIALHHIHLPKLDACGLIDHDTETDRVRSATGELGQELLALIAPYEAPR